MDELKEIAKDVVRKTEDKYEERLTKEEIEQLRKEEMYESNRWENYF